MTGEDPARRPEGQPRELGKPNLRPGGFGEPWRYETVWRHALVGDTYYHQGGAYTLLELAFPGDGYIWARSRKSISGAIIEEPFWHDSVYRIITPVLDGGDRAAVTAFQNGGFYVNIITGED